MVNKNMILLFTSAARVLNSDLKFNSGGIVGRPIPPFSRDKFKRVLDAFNGLEEREPAR